MPRLKSLFLILLAAAGMASAFSCSIKEDRTGCPCQLTLDYSGTAPEDRSDGILTCVWSDDGENILRREVSDKDLSPAHGFKVTVPKGIARVTALVGTDNYSLSYDAASFMLRTGEQADSLFARSETVDCTGESAYDTIILHKQWCGLTVNLVNFGLGEEAFAMIEGNWAGFSLSDLSPLEGQFRCKADRTAEGTFRARIPRQCDDSLSFTLKAPGLNKEYPVGQLIAEAGYDWKAEDLGDIILSFDKFTGEFTVEVTPWKEDDGYGEIEI